MSKLEQARKRLRGRYLGRLPDSVAALRTALNRPCPDVAAIGRIAHRLRGSGGTYGFDEITTLAIAVQNAPAETLRLHTDRLITLCDELARGAQDANALPAETIHGSLAALVVEDDESMAELVVTVCGMMGFRCDTVGTVRHAHEMLAGSQLELVVLDMMLPDGTGLDVLRTLRTMADPPSAVVALTMLDDPDLMKDAGELRLDAYLLKPLDTREFCDVVQRLVPGATMVVCRLVDRVLETSPRS